MKVSFFGGTQTEEGPTMWEKWKKNRMKGNVEWDEDKEEEESKAETNAKEMRSKADRTWEKK